MASDEASRGASPQPPAQRPNQPPPPAPTPSPTPSPTPPAYDNPAFASDEPDRVESNGGAHLAEEKNGSPAKLNGNHRRDISGLDRTPQQKKDPAEAVNLELVNLPAARHQNGSSVPALPNEATDTRLPHKKDAHNETSNYDEYFVPVNEHKKYMRGEKLYVTAEKGRSGGSAGGRKKACWIAGLLALAVAVVIAVLAGTGVIFSNDATALRNDTFSASAARSFGSQAAANHPNRIEAPSDEALLYVPKAVEGVFVIDNAQFVEELSSSDSRAFKSFAPALEEAILNALFDSQTRNYGANDLHVKIVNFTSGSIVVRYRVSWSPKNGIKANDPITMETLNIKLKSYLEKNSNQLSKYQIRTEGMKSERIIDLCKFNNNGCENGCEFNRNQLRFVCICPDGKVPDRSNPKKCVEPQYIDLGSSDMPDYLDVSKVVPVSNANPKPVPEGEPEPGILTTTESGWAEPKFFSTAPSSEPEPKAEPATESGWAEPKFLSSEPSSEPEPKAEPPTEPGWAEPKFLSAEPSSEPEPKAEPTTESGWAEPKFLSSETSSEPEPKAEPTTEPGWAEPKFLSAEPSSEPEPKAEPTTEPGWAEPKFLSTEASSEPEPKAEPGWVEPKFLSTEASSEVEPKAEPKAEQTTESGWAEPKFLSAEPSSEPEPTTESGWAEPKFLSTEPSNEPEPKGDPKAEQTTESGWAEPKFLSTEPSSKPEIKIERESSQDGSNFEGRSLSVITLEPEIQTTHQIEIEHPVTKESNLSKGAISEGSKPSSDKSLWIEPKIYKSSNNNSEQLNLKPNNATANESILIEPTSLDDEWLDPSFISDSTNSLWTEPKMFSFSSNDSSMTNDFTNFTKSVRNISISSVQNSTVNSISSVKKSDFFEPKFITSSESSAINLSSSRNSSEREPSWSEPEFMFTTTDGSSIVQKIPSLSTAPVVDLVSSTVASTETMWSNPKFMESSGENISSTETMWLEPKYTNLPIHVSSNSSSSDDMWSEPQSNSLSENITNVVNSQDTAKTDSNVMMILDVKAKAFKHNNANVAVVSVGNGTSISVSSNDESASEENNASENNLENSERNISAAWAIPKYIYDLQNASKHQDESSTLSGGLHSNPAPVWEEPEIEAEHVYTYKNLDDEDAVTLSSTSLTSKTTSNEILHTSESNYLLFGSTHAHDDANTTANDDGWMEPQIPLSTNKGLKPHIYEVTTQPNEDRASVSYHFVHSNATTEMSPFLPDLEGHGDILHERHELETSGEHEYKKIEEPLNVQPLLTDSSSSKSHYDDDSIASSTEGVSETAVLNETKSGLSVKMTENESLAVSNKSSDKESLWEEPSYNNSLSNDDDWQSASTTSQHDEESLSVLPLSKPSKKYEYSKKYDKHQKSDDSSELNDIFNGKNRNNR